MVRRTPPRPKNECHHEDPSENPSATEDEEGEEQEDRGGTDPGAHRKDPERAPARVPEPEVAAIAEDVLLPRHALNSQMKAAVTTETYDERPAQRPITAHIRFKTRTIIVTA